jgi:hypothetical protein
MNTEPVILIRSVTVETRPTPDRLTRWLVILIALGLAWQALRPHVTPVPAEASRDIVTVNIERVGGRFLTDGAIPVKCLR